MENEAGRALRGLCQQPDVRQADARAPAPGQVTHLHQNQVGQAGFAVLKSPNIPSLLVEPGFMRNRDDCRRLCGDTHQDALAQTLHAGIDDYFQAFPGRA